MTIVAALLLSACGVPSDTASTPQTSSPILVTGATGPPPQPTPAEPRAESLPTATTTTTTSTTTTSTTSPQVTVEELLFVGDSISAQLHFAARQRSAARGGPTVKWLLTAGAGYHEGWPDPLPEFIENPAATAIVTTFSIWQATPPEQVDDTLADLTRAELLDEMRAFLLPLNAPGFARPTLVLLLHSIDDPQADAQLQLANSLIAEAAVEVGLPVEQTIAGIGLDGAPIQVTVEGQEFPVRSGLGDKVHYCAAAALVMADQLLDDLGVPPRPLEVADLEDLYELAPENYFDSEGC